jgi:membrane protein
MTPPRDSPSSGWQRSTGYATAVVRRFYGDECLIRASALAYTSLLSMVPLFAIMFAVLKGLGVQHRLEPILLSRLSLAPETTELIIGYIDRTNVGTIGAIGAATLVMTVISVLGTIEASFNVIWRVVQARTYWRKVTDYLGVVMLTPFLLLAGVAITSAAQVQTVLAAVLHREYIGGALRAALQLSPIVINAAGVGILYAVMPNRRPAWRPVVIGAVVAGTAWHVVQWLYIKLQIGVAGYSAVYGALAQLPVTLAWLYVSWVVVLAGAELAAVLEFGPVPGAATRIDPEAVALELLVRASDAFRRGASAVDASAVATEIDVPAEMVERIAGILVGWGWLATTADPPRIVLARDPHAIQLAQLAALGTATAIPARCDPRTVAGVRGLHAICDAALAERTLAEIITPIDLTTENAEEHRGTATR